MKRTWQSIVYASCLAVLLGGCASGLKGPAFQPIPDAAADKAVVYLYWPDEGLRTAFNIEANEESITTMKNGGYFPYVVEPSELDLSAKVKFKMFASGFLEAVTAPHTRLSLTVQDGEVYYVRCTGLPPALLSLSLTNGQRLGMQVVSNEVGSRGIQACKLLAAK